MLSFLDRNILVTGGGSGIGKATALLLGGQQASVVIVDQNRETAHRTVDELKQIGCKARAIVADISNPDAVEQM